MDFSTKHKLKNVKDICERGRGKCKVSGGQVEGKHCCTTKHRDAQRILHPHVCTHTHTYITHTHTSHAPVLGKSCLVTASHHGKDPVQIVLLSKYSWTALQEVYRKPIRQIYDYMTNAYCLEWLRSKTELSIQDNNW